MLALYILGSILLVLLLLLLIPVRVELAFREAFLLVIGYGPLRIPIPLEVEEETEKPQEEEKTPSAKKEGPGRLKQALKREGFWGFLQALADFIGAASRVTGRLLSHLKLRQFDLYLCLAGSYDAADAAVRYGQLSAGVYGACGLLFSLMPCKKKGVTVDLDYSAAENRVDFSTCLSLRPIFALHMALKVLWSAIPLLRKLRAGPKFKSKSRSVKADEKTN